MRRLSRSLPRPLAAALMLLAAPACDEQSDESGGGTAPTGVDGAPAGGCGWGSTRDDQVPDGYTCGGEGPDPDGRFAMGCPDDVPLEVGGACGSIGGPGCCDAMGNAWFCGDDGSGPALAQIEC